MKERLKMIFDRIDIFVVCIVFGCCLHCSGGIHRNLGRVCSFVYDDFPYY